MLSAVVIAFALMLCSQLKTRRIENHNGSKCLFIGFLPCRDQTLPVLSGSASTRFYHSKRPPGVHAKTLSYHCCSVMNQSLSSAMTNSANPRCWNTATCVRRCMPLSQQFTCMLQCYSRLGVCINNDIEGRYLRNKKTVILKIVGNR